MKIKVGKNFKLACGRTCTVTEIKGDLVKWESIKDGWTGTIDRHELKRQMKEYRRS